LNDGSPGAEGVNAPRIISRADHTISRSDISPNALRVLYRLKDAGFQAFLVGGCVRDLMLGRHPKDFDVATGALPEEVRKLFRNCRLIGRRFRLAHVYFGREVIEVATFRAATAPAAGDEPMSEEELEQSEALVEGAGDDADDAAGVPAETPFDEERVLHEVPEEAGELEAASEAASDAASTAASAGAAPLTGSGTDSVDHERVLDPHGRLLRDNLYGTIEEDVWRRDFTVNALYYNIADFSVWDYVGGAEDIAARRLRLIGDPETRYREDPVRMLRAARFEAKLGLTLEPLSAAPIAQLKRLLASVPPARLFDETQKLFLTGHGERSLEALRRRALLEELFPSVERYLSAHPGAAVEKLLRLGLGNTDARVLAGKPVAPTFLFALLLYGPIVALIESQPPERWHELSAITGACERALHEATARVSIPRRIALGVREMYALQPRLEHPRGRRVLRLLEQPRFRAGFDLLQLRAQIGLAPREMAEWWTRLQAASPAERAQMVDVLVKQRAAAEGDAGAERSGRGRPRRRRRRGRRSAGPY
jgi:poly(A) polymerase